MIDDKINKAKLTQSRNFSPIKKAEEEDYYTVMIQKQNATALDDDIVMVERPEECKQQ